MATKEEMKRRLDEMDAEWTPPAPAEPFIHPARLEELEAKRRREEKEARLLAEQRRKETAQRRQYAETNQAFLAGIIGDDPNVAAAAAAIDTAQRAVDELSSEYEGVIAQIGAIQNQSMVDLRSLSMKELLATATERSQRQTVELGALVAVRDEVGRRLAEAGAALVERRHTHLRLQRVALHVHCDLLIEQLHPLLITTHSLFDELYKTQDAVRDMGGARQPLGSGSWKDRLSWLVERWDKELAEIQTFSEQY